MGLSNTILDQPDQDMIIDTVDLNDNIIGKIRRSEILESRQNFRTVHVFLFNKKNELLIQKISSKNIRHPFYWGSSMAGYLFSGEDYEMAALRRMEQELSLKINPRNLKFIGKALMNEVTGHKIIGLFRYEWDYEVNPNPELIVDTKYCSINEIDRLIKNNELQFTPTFHLLLDFYKSHYS